jgi:predicted DNA-binding transcriptional regulator AlpA
MARLAIAVAAALALIAVAPAGAAAKSCRPVIDTGPTGFDPADSDGLRTTGVGCSLARKLASKAGLIAVKQDVKLHGFACHDVGMRRDGTFPQRCRSGKRSVVWVLRNAERRCSGTVFIADPGVTVRFWVQGIPCARGRHVLVNSDPYPAGWSTARDPFTGDQHVIKSHGRHARIRYRPV